MPPRRTTGILVFTLGFVLLSVNVRAPFGQIGPLAPVAGFSPALVSLLGLLPPLAMGVVAPLGPVLRRALGDERTLIAACAVELLGAGVRPFGVAGLVAGTTVAAAGIGVMNVLIPVLARRRFPARRVGAAMAGYALAMGGGAALVGATALPVFHATGSWPAAIAVAVVPAIAALVIFAAQWRHGERAAADPQRRRAHGVQRTWLAWSLLFLFGVQSLLFYTALAWLPTLLVGRGVAPASAGLQLQLLIVAVAVGGAGGAALAGAGAGQRAVVAGLAVLTAAGWCGVAADGTARSALWAVVLGLGLGAGQAVPGVLYARRGRDHAHAAALSTFAQCGGFFVAAAGPPLAVSAAHALPRGWVAVALAAAGLALVNLPLSLRAGRADAAPVAGTERAPRDDVSPAASR